MSFVPPNESELESVQRLKDRIEKENADLVPHFNDTTILRFFRGHKLKEDPAYEALIRYANWRIEEDVDNVANPETLVKFKKEIDSGKVVFGFRDLNGRPASFLWAHRHKANDRDIAQVKLLTIWTLEGLRKLAKPEEEMFVICFDLSRFSMSCMDYEAVKQLITILQAHYPDTLAKLLLIDAPFLFSACWAIIRGWLDPVTANKVQFIKKSDLSKFFDVETLPQEGEIQLEA